jgi:hypothetical protein
VQYFRDNYNDYKSKYIGFLKDTEHESLKKKKKKTPKYKLIIEVRFLNSTDSEEKQYDPRTMIINVISFLINNIRTFL